MNEVTLYILHQIAKFGALTIHQLEKLCLGRCSRATIYRNLNNLIQAGCVMRVSHPLKITFAFAATSTGFKAIYSVPEKDVPALPLQELSHTLACADAMLSLALYSNVSSIVTEREVHRGDFKEFSFFRIPDGIVEIKSDTVHCELAIEVETSSKSSERIREILLNYEKTFEKDMPCRGVIFVIPKNDVFNRYQSILEDLQKRSREKILLSRDISLPNLKESLFGKRLPDVRKACEKVRTDSQGVISYIPIETDTSVLGNAASTPINRGTVSNDNLRSNL